MGHPAVPEYLNQHLFNEGNDLLRKSISPGQRFGLFFPYWDAERWTTDSQDKSKTNALKQVLPLSPECRGLLHALTSRQDAIAQTAGDRALKLEAFSSAPFMTGIGNEHPLENGFSFLNPYGLPYLPGSAVKGTLRRAAEELCGGQFTENGGWQPLFVWLLFGFDGGSGCFQDPGWQAPDSMVREIAEYQQKAYLDGIVNRGFDAEALHAFMKCVLPRELQTEYADKTAQFLFQLGGHQPAAPFARPIDRKEVHFQGALSFWDVFPIPPTGPDGQEYLRMDILTPHYGEYYQNGATPADCGQPIPNPFLTVAPGCRLSFHVQCEEARLPESLRGIWRALLKSAFGHAFDWLGFGAKTAVGYGQMSPESSGVDTSSRLAEITMSQVLTPPPLSTPKNQETWEKASLSWNRSQRCLVATHADGKRKTAPWREPDRSRIPVSLHQPLFEAKKPKPVYARVTVSTQGNCIELLSIEAS